MTTKRIREELARRNKLLDARADSLLERFIRSKWTGLILLAGFVAFVAALVL